jgi:hypothetical protein
MLLVERALRRRTRPSKRPAARQGQRQELNRDSPLDGACRAVGVPPAALVFWTVERRSPRRRNERGWKLVNRTLKIGPMGALIFSNRLHPIVAVLIRRG